MTSSLGADTVARPWPYSRIVYSERETRIVTTQAFEAFHRLVADQQQVTSPSPPRNRRAEIIRQSTNQSRKPNLGRTEPAGSPDEAAERHNQRSAVRARPLAAQRRGAPSNPRRNPRQARRNKGDPHRQPTDATEKIHRHPKSRTIPIVLSSLDACLEFARHAFSFTRFEGALGPMSKYNEKQFSSSYASTNTFFLPTKPHPGRSRPPQR